MKLNGAAFREESVAPYTMSGDANAASQVHRLLFPDLVLCDAPRTTSAWSPRVARFECISSPSAPPSIMSTIAPATTPSYSPPTGPGDASFETKIGVWTRVLPDYPVHAIEGQGNILDGNLVPLGVLTENYKNTTEICYAISVSVTKQSRLRRSTLSTAAKMREHRSMCCLARWRGSPTRRIPQS